MSAPIPHFPDKPPVNIRCQECGAGLLLPPARAQGRKYCSRACYHAVLRREIAAGIRALPGGPHTPEGRQRATAALQHNCPTERLKDWWEDRGYTWVDCIVCGQSFPTRALKQPLYCSAACRNRRQYERYVQARECICMVCGRTFYAHAHRPRPTCGRSCGKTLQSLTRTRWGQNLILYAPDGDVTPFAGARPHLHRATLAP